MQSISDILEARREGLRLQLREQREDQDAAPVDDVTHVRSPLSRILQKKIAERFIVGFFLQVAINAMILVAFPGDTEFFVVTLPFAVGFCIAVYVLFFKKFYAMPLGMIAGFIFTLSLFGFI